MKRKILFIIPTLDHGGTNRSLQNMLSLLDSNKYDFFIFSFSRYGVYRDIFSIYNIINTPSYIFCFCKSRNLIIRLLRYFDRFCGDVILKLVFAFFVKRLESFYKFDKVVAFEEGSSKLLAAFFKVPKIAWIHCDYKLYYTLFKPNLKKEYSIYSSFDNIVCVSQYTMQSFNSFFPELANKVVAIYNTLNVRDIISLSDEVNDIDVKFDTNSFVIMSVGRFSPVKQFDIIPYIANEIYKRKIDFKWYIIGDGNEKVKINILAEIKRYKLENIIILLGAKENPYPYIKRSNLLVLTSSSEACPYVVNEAKVLHTPVLVSRFESAFELVNDDNGIISNMYEMPSIICKLINDENSQYSLLCKRNELTTYDNGLILKSLDQILF